MKRDTKLVHAGRPPHVDGRRPVNPPIVRASTVDFETIEGLEEAGHAGIAGEQSFTYGVHGTPTTFALESFITELERGYGTRLFSSGLDAISSVFLALLKPGDHVLVVDSVYAPVRSLVTRFLAERGIAYDFYSPRDVRVERFFRPETRLVYAETPGSVTMELQDIRRLSHAVRRHERIILACDNTWSSGYCFRPLEHGAHLSIIAGTKYLCGHSDVVIGSVTADESVYPLLHQTRALLGSAVSPDDCALTLRGARTLHIRYPEHARRALQVAEWLESHAAVAQVHYPALPSSPDHSQWTALYEGAAGLFGVELAGFNDGQARRFVNCLRLFGKGASWGGFESLALPCDMVSNRSIEDWSSRGAVVRLHIGLEDPGDLIEDLGQALRAASAAGPS